MRIFIISVAAFVVVTLVAFWQNHFALENQWNNEVATEPDFFTPLPFEDELENQNNDSVVLGREPILVSQGAQHAQIEELEKDLLKKQLKVLEDENDRLKEQLQLCRSSSEETPLGVFLRLPQVAGNDVDEETISWMKLVSEYYPIRLTDGEAMALAERKVLLTSDESWHQGVIDTLGGKRIVSAMENWTDSQKQKLADDVSDEEASLLGLSR